eukprot:m.107580 g.107580  ORF g.107580 m.107580 type:complete len:376 (-) comp15846_c0_seq1:190-1317(-)
MAAVLRGGSLGDKERLEAAVAAVLGGRIMVLTGAGTAVAAGIPDFRGTKGIYRQTGKAAGLPPRWKPDDLFRRARFRADPQPLTDLLTALADKAAIVHCTDRTALEQQRWRQQQQDVTSENQQEEQDSDVERGAKRQHTDAEADTDAPATGSAECANRECASESSASANMLQPTRPEPLSSMGATASAACLLDPDPDPDPAITIDPVAGPACVQLPASYLLVEALHARHQLVRWYTQNIDGLELKTAVPREHVAFLHGCLPLQHPLPWPPSLIEDSIAFYGDCMRGSESLAADTAAADTLLVLGTSLAAGNAAAIVADFPGHRILVCKSAVSAQAVKLPPRRVKWREIGGRLPLDISLDMDVHRFAAEVLSRTTG